MDRRNFLKMTGFGAGGVIGGLLYSPLKKMLMKDHKPVKLPKNLIEKKHFEVIKENGKGALKMVISINMESWRLLEETDKYLAFSNDGKIIRVGDFDGKA